MGNSLGMLAAKEPDFKFTVSLNSSYLGRSYGSPLTHVSILIVVLLLLIFALVVRS